MSAPAGDKESNNIMSFPFNNKDNWVIYKSKGFLN